MMKDVEFKCQTPSVEFSRLTVVYVTAFILFMTSATSAFSQSQLSNTSTSNLDREAEPIAFSRSYLGFLLNQNHPWSYGTKTWSKGGPSWGTEYRFFYKDTWTLAITGAFKHLEDNSGNDAPIFSLSQETMKILRVYHPWYVAAGGRLSYFFPVRRVMLPYERDQSRAIDTGAAISVATIWIAHPKVVVIVSANRWRSLSTTKSQGLELATTALISIR